MSLSLQVRTKCFGWKNIFVAISHEDLAYSSYVKEYNSGRFSNAKSHAERSLQIFAK